jgi:hypothetical protein
MASSPSLQGIVETQNTKIKIMTSVTPGTGAIFKFQDGGPRPGGLKGCAIRRSCGIAVLGVSSLVLKLPWPSDHVCNSGTWKIPVRPGAPRRRFQCGAKFPERKSAGFFSRNSREKSGENGEKFGFVIFRIQALQHNESLVLNGGPYLQQDVCFSFLVHLSNQTQ